VLALSGHDQAKKRFPEMKSLNLLCVSLLTLVLLHACGESTDDQVAPSVNVDQQTSVLALMLSTVVPASDTLWGVDDPQTDADWQVLADAADQTILAFEKIRQGGSGDFDNDWAKDPRWQTHIDNELSAARAAILAIENRDLDALYNANDMLYTPCEECHIDFNPGVQSEQ